MNEDWVAVSGALNARMAALRITQLDLAAKSGVSPATIRELQHHPNRPRKRYGRTLAALSEALEWPTDHLDGVLTGRPATDLDPTPPDGVLAELRAIRGELVSIRARLDALETPERSGGT